MPVGNVFIGNARGHVEHNDTALAVDIVAITQTTKLFLTCGIPHIKDNLTKVL